MTTIGEQFHAHLLARARELGRRAFARGDEVNDNIYQQLARAFDEGYDEASVHNEHRLDMGGHPAPPPHLCPETPGKVCVCCTRCAAPCQPTVANGLRSLGRAVVQIARVKLGRQP